MTGEHRLTFIQDKKDIILIGNPGTGVITTNLPFARWGDIFDGTTVATAIADRPVYNSEILIMEGNVIEKDLNRNL